MNILDKTFPALENLTTETFAMLSVTRLANAIVEASDLVKALPEIRQAMQKLTDEVQVLREQIERARARETEALASRDKQANQVDALAAELLISATTIETLRADLETINRQRLDAEQANKINVEAFNLLQSSHDALEREHNETQRERDVNAKKLWDCEVERDTLRQSLTTANDTINALHAEFTDLSARLRKEVEEWRTRADAHERKLLAIMEVITA